MPLLTLKITDFRCFGSVELEADPRYTLIHGANASGKTSVLEAIAYLGRGRSFRGANTQDLIRHGYSEFVLFGRITVGERSVGLGVRNSRAGLEVRVDGRSRRGASTLATELPLQVIDPEVHKLVAGGPEERRRYLDWIAFHVEQGYLESWRRFRRVLKQRNAALRGASSEKLVFSWDQEFIEAAQCIHRNRLAALATAQTVFAVVGRSLLGASVELVYRQGWKSELSLGEALAASFSRDRELGNTHVGPHRADIRLVFDARQAKKLVSRGQQKLLACAMILTSIEVVQDHLQRPVLLLLDDPAAELDGDSLQRLMTCVCGLGCQVIATALVPDRPLFPEVPALFHVEQGGLKKTTCGASAPNRTG